MNHSGISWKMLSGTVVILLVSLVIDAGIIMSGLQYGNDLAEKLDKLQKTIATLRTQAKQQVEQGRHLIATKPRYEELERMGVLGAEPRMKWLDALKDAEQVLKLPAPIQYKLEPARHYTPAFPMPPGEDFQLFASKMELTLGLLHEGDLFNLMEFLEKKQVGLFQYKKCELQVVSGESRESGRFKPGVNLQGVCVMEWFTFREKGGHVK